MDLLDGIIDCMLSAVTVAGSVLIVIIFAIAALGTGVLLGISSTRSTIRILALPVRDESEVHTVGASVGGMIVLIIGMFAVVFEGADASMRNNTANHYTATWMAIACIRAYCECLATMLTLRVAIEIVVRLFKLSVMGKAVMRRVMGLDAKMDGKTGGKMEV
jgi:hypothetical protein